MAKNIVSWRVLFFIGSGFLIYFFCSQILVHDWYLWQFSQNYSKVQHPPDTYHIRRYKELGLLIANGNHIDLFVGDIRSFSGERQQIIDWYANRTISSQLAEGDLVALEVFFLEDSALVGARVGKEQPSTINKIIDDADKFTNEAKEYYIVYALDSVSFDPGFDPRGY